MFRLLLIAGLLLLLYYFVRRAILNRGEQGRWLGVGKGHAKGDHMVQDPVCRVFIPRGNAVKEEIGGQVYYFCSSACAKTFQKQLSS
jgi:YHS domain-containing protein